MALFLIVNSIHNGGWKYKFFCTQIFIDFIVWIKCVTNNSMHFILKILNNISHRNMITYPCFGFLVTSPLGFKARVVSTLFSFCGGKCNVHSLRSISGATHINLLAAGMQPVTSSHACAEVGLALDSNGQSPRQTNALPLSICDHSTVCDPLRGR